MQEKSVDWKRFNIYCDMIPPKSTWDFRIDSDLHKEIIKTKSIYIEYWGETTPHKEEWVFCNS